MLMKLKERKNKKERASGKTGIWNRKGMGTKKGTVM